MSKNCAIMQRMKENYEKRSRHYLTRRMPVILRIDGKAFHTYTRGLDKPFDEGLMEDMIETTKYLCSKIQGAKCGYTQSDEISILLTDYENLQTDAFFNYEIQKICSVAASMAASKFNQLRLIRWGFALDEVEIYAQPLADFDCRAFNIPKEEVANYFLARQKDAVKNSVSMVAQSMYSHSELHKKNQSDMQEMIFQKGLNWNDLHYSKKRGTFVVKNTYVNNIKVGNSKDEICYQPHNQGLYPDKRGRALQYAMSTEGFKDWCDIKIETIRSKWEAVETPLKFNEENFKQWL